MVVVVCKPTWKPLTEEKHRMCQISFRVLWSTAFDVTLYKWVTFFQAERVPLGLYQI